MSTVSPARILNPVWRFGDFFLTIYEYREYFKQSIARDLRKQYKRSVLGYVWSMLHPLLMMAILAIVFSNIMKRPAKEYAIFLFTGMLAWEYFNATVTQNLRAIRSNLNIISQVPVPKYLFSLSYAFSNLVNLFLSLLPLMLIMLLVGRPFHLTILALPLVLLPLFIFTMAVSLFVAVANVFFEDTQHLTTVVLRALYFLCPILYGPEHLPQSLLTWLRIDPMFSIIEFMRDIFMEGKLPDPALYLTNLAGVTMLLIVVLWIFHRADDKFIYFA